MTLFTAKKLVDYTKPNESFIFKTGYSQTIDGLKYFSSVFRNIYHQFPFITRSGSSLLHFTSTSLLCRMFSFLYSLFVNYVRRVFLECVLVKGESCKFQLLMRMVCAVLMMLSLVCSLLLFSLCIILFTFTFFSLLLSQIFYLSSFVYFH